MRAEIEKILGEQIKNKTHNLSFAGLKVTQEEFVNIVKRASLEELPLASVDFSGSKIHTLPNGILSKFKNLQNVVFKGSDISKIESRAFAGLTELTTIDLSENKLFELESSWFESQKHSLERLNVARNQIGSHRFCANNFLKPVELVGVNRSTPKAETLRTAATEPLDPEKAAQNFMAQHLKQRYAENAKLMNQHFAQWSFEGPSTTTQDEEYLGHGGKEGRRKEQGGGGHGMGF